MFSGDIRSPRRWNGTLEPRAGIEYNLQLRGKETAMIDVKGDGHGAALITLTDESKEVVDEDKDDSDTCSLKVIPSHTSDYKVVIVNNGKNQAW